MFSMQDKMERCYRLANDLFFTWDVDGHVADHRNLPLSPEEDATVDRWFEGDMHRYVDKMIEGLCSLAESLAFDIAAFEETTVDSDLATLERLIIAYPAVRAEGPPEPPVSVEPEDINYVVRSGSSGWPVCGAAGHVVGDQVRATEAQRVGIEGYAWRFYLVPGKIVSRGGELVKIVVVN